MVVGYHHFRKHPCSPSWICLSLNFRTWDSSPVNHHAGEDVVLFQPTQANATPFIG